MPHVFALLRDVVVNELAMGPPLGRHLLLRGKRLFGKCHVFALTGWGTRSAGRLGYLSKGCNKKFSCASTTPPALKNNEKGRKGEESTVVLNLTR